MTSKKTDTLTIHAEPRTAFGKKVKNLRKQGLMPANIYGEGMESMAISVTQKDFHKTYRAAGETQLLYVHIDSKDIPTQIRNAQRHPLTGDFIHTDFKKVNLRKKVETAVPVEFINESDAVEKKHGELNVMMDEIMILALPADIPQSIQIDLTPLKEIGDEIAIKDLPVVETYEFVAEPDEVIVRVNEHVEQSIEPELTTEIPETETGEEEAATVESSESSSDSETSESSESSS